jgi:hypothetical protein
MERCDQVYWHAHLRLDKYDGDWSPEDIAAGLAADALVETLERDDNLLLIGGASALWERLIGTTITAYSNANARIGVGDSTTAAADTQTDLQAATNKTYKAMDATYPTHTDSTGTAGSKSITFRSTFGTADANYAWQEWIIDNGTRALNRKVENLGTKTSAGTWVLTITLSLA